MIIEWLAGVGRAAYVVLQSMLPQHTISRLVHRLTRIETRWFKLALIRGFSRLFRVDIADAARRDPAQYRSFNDFFTRELDPSLRAPAPDGQAVLSPVDGTVSALGRAEGDQLLQAKDRKFSLRALLGGDTALAAVFSGGDFATLYLSPRDYHRVHMPVSGRLVSMHFVPGRLFSVDARTTRAVRGLFARNERVVSIFDTSVGHLAVIMVGAMCVGSIETVWQGEVTPGGGREPRTWRYPAPGPEAVLLERGAELGRFNMGSTVIVLFQQPGVAWDPALGPGAGVTMGRPIATPRTGGMRGSADAH